MHSKGATFQDVSAAATALPVVLEPQPVSMQAQLQVEVSLLIVHQQSDRHGSTRTRTRTSNELIRPVKSSVGQGSCAARHAGRMCHRIAFTVVPAEMMPLLLLLHHFRTHTLGFPMPVCTLCQVALDEAHDAPYLGIAPLGRARHWLRWWV